MGLTKHIVERKAGVCIHREVPEVRSAEQFLTCKVSSDTRTAFRNVCVNGGAGPEDYRRCFSALLGKDVVDEILLES
ncbi:hypothetical protein [Maridesulfovibrio bastinii]|uniref:hypothetical protein n=1 Tax=Maridesulfovibrio bastinii TaxID=47157 RepID=UPI00041D5F07|nr:hypothetical protein [Maridesulfovibrio bastinii]